MAGRATRGGRKTITPETGISAKFDDTEYKEQGAGYDGPAPPDGLYPMKLVSAKQHTTSDTAIEWQFDIAEGKYAGWRGWMYSDLGSMKWKTQNILVALGLMEPEGEINHTFEAILKGAGPVRGRIKKEEYQEEYKPKLQGVIKSSGKVEDSDADEEADEDFDDEEEEKKPAAKAKASPPARRSRAAKKDPEPEPEEDDEEEDEDEEEGLDLDALEEELEDMDLKQLKAKAKEFGAKLADYKGLDEEELIDLILEKAEEQNPSF